MKTNKQTKFKKNIEFVLPEEIKRDFKTPITFRTDPKTYSKIVTLEKTMDKSKAIIIKEAISNSFESLIFDHFNMMIFDAVNEIFKESEVKESIIIKKPSKRSDEDNKNKNPFIESDIPSTNISDTLYETKQDNFSTRNKLVEFNLSSFSTEITTEPNEDIKIKFSQNDVIVGDINKINPNTYFKIIDIITKKNLKIETFSDKGKIYSNIIFEIRGSAKTCKMGIKLFKKNLKDIKKIIQEIEEILKKSKDIIIRKKE